MDLHVFPIPIPPPTSLPIPFHWVFPAHQPWALVSCIQPGQAICFTLDNIHVSMLFSQSIPPLPSSRNSIPNPGIESGSPVLQTDSLPIELSGTPHFLNFYIFGNFFDICLLLIFNLVSSLISFAFSCPFHMVHKIPVSWPGRNMCPQKWKRRQSPNHWTTREFPLY